MKFNQRGVVVSPNARIGNNVKIGDNTTIYDHVEIGDNTVIANDCVIGEPLNAYYFQPEYQNPVTRIGGNSLIRSHSIIYAGCTLGEGLSTGHRVMIRENTQVGVYCRIGTNCDIQGHLTLGNYCWLHSDIFIAQYSTISDFVMIYPKVMLANDRFPPSNEAKGPTIGKFSQIAACSMVMAGIQIGEQVLVGGGSVVVRDIPNFSLVTGNPAKHLKDVRELIDPDTGKPLYPWMIRFDRGMPWEGIGYEEWAARNG